VARPVSFRFLFLSLFVLFCPFELSLNAPVKRDKKRQKRTKRERQKRMDAQSVYLAPTQALRRLAAFLDETGSKLTPLDAATMAINQWIATERDQFTDVTASPTLALVQHVSAQELPPVERRQVRARRNDDVLSNISEDD
jgi:hypothetical protein